MAVVYGVGADVAFILGLPVVFDIDTGFEVVGVDVGLTVVGVIVGLDVDEFDAGGRSTSSMT